MFCPNCGKEIEDGSKFCPFCGGAVAAKRKVNGKLLGIIAAVLVVVVLVVVIGGNGGKKFKLGGNTYDAISRNHQISFQLPYSNEQMAKEGYRVELNYYNPENGTFSWENGYNYLEIEWEYANYCLTKSDIDDARKEPLTKFYETSSKGVPVYAVYGHDGVENGMIAVAVNDEANGECFIINVEGPALLITPEVAEAMAKAVKVK